MLAITYTLYWSIMPSNRVKKEFTTASIWVAPAGVTQVTISLIDKLDQLLYKTAPRMMLKRTQALFGVGLNDAGELGDQTIVRKSSPVPVLGGHSFVKIINSSQSTYALKADGSAWAWGSGFQGQIGDNTNGALASKSLPVAVLGGHRFIDGNCRESAFFLKADGSIWSWGTNTNGQLGDNSIVNKSSPVAVIGGHSFIRVRVGSSCVHALKADGSIWSWGTNQYGNLGDGTIASKSSPVQALGGHSFIAFATGNGYLNALKVDGSVWSWGRNDQGEIGDGTTLHKSSPVQALGGHSFISLSTSSAAALKSDGSAWTWGYNGSGELGDGTITDRASPVPVIGGHSFVFLHKGSVSSSYAIKENGSIWSWGFNTDGTIGDGTSDRKSSPVAVVGGHSFIQLALGGTPAALKTDGTVWTWGSGAFGELGDNTQISKSSPVAMIGGHFYQTGSQIIVEKMVTVVPGTSYTMDMLAAGILGIAPQQILGNNVFIVIEYET
jgi:alpha-tubulin suppressor-like RCC1 family protein